MVSLIWWKFSIYTIYTSSFHFACKTCVWIILTKSLFAMRPPHVTHSTTETHACLKWSAKPISIADVQNLTTEWNYGIYVEAMDIHVITIHMFKRLNHPDEKVYPPKIYRYYESMVSLIWSKKLDIGPRIWKFQNTLMVKITKMDTIGIWVCRLSSGDIFPVNTSHPSGHSPEQL